MTTDSPLRRVERVRHPLEVRRCTVLRVVPLTPGVVRVTFGGEALRRFVSASFDDHVKLMLPPPGGRPLVLPVPGPDGPALPADAERPTMRDFTPRSFDPSRGELDIEFALHGHGPAAAWAARAQPGQEVGIGGPRGSLVIPTDFDWHLLVGDETALPAIARRLEELPADATVIARVQTRERADRRGLRSAADVRLHWLDANEPDALAAAVANLEL
ncbi:MAG: siderophore-interacting protein, partial [Burkholderiaceae bacterium]